VRSASLSRDGLGALAGRGLSLAGSFLVGVSVARLSGPAATGQFFTWTAITGFAAVVGSQGVNREMLQYVVHREEGWVKAVYSSLARVTIVSVFVSLLMVPFFLVTTPIEPLHLAVAGTLAIMGRSLSLAAGEPLAGMGKMRQASLYGFWGSSGGVLASITIPIFLLVIWILELPGLAVIAYAYSVPILVAGLCSVRALLQPLPKTRWKGLWRIQSSFESRSRKFWLIGLFAYTRSQLDVVIVSLAVSSSAAATYGAAYRLSTAAAIPGLVLIMVIPSRSLNRLRLPTRLVTLSVTIAAVTAVGLSLVASQVLSLVFGSEYAGGAMVLRLLLLGEVLNTVAVATSIILAIDGRVIPYLYGTSASLVTVFLGALLTWRSGDVRYVATAVALSYAVQALFQYGAMRRGRQFAVLG
jgi:O-antigen/teichoic acid export membrane protein